MLMDDEQRKLRSERMKKVWADRKAKKVINNDIEDMDRMHRRWVAQRVRKKNFNGLKGDTDTWGADSLVDNIEKNRLT